MRLSLVLSASFIAGLLATSAAQAECTGGLGRGWASGKGDGKFEMAAGDKHCVMSYPAFINDATKTKTFATKVALSRAPKSGKITLSPDGVVYTPAAGFKGSDKFCTKNTTDAVKGTLSGCITVTVR